MTLIWGLRAGRTGRLGELEQRARILLTQLDDEKASVVVPTVVVAEFLAPVLPEHHGKLILEFQRRFLCPPFDLQAASLAAALWRAHRELPKNEQLQRKTLKADVLIVATATVAGATIFFSNDAKCRKLARIAKMEARDLPRHSENLFIDREVRGE